MITLHDYDDNHPNHEGGPCTSLRCKFSRIRPKATFFYKPQKAWVCLSCAQKENAEAYRRKAQYKPCVSGKEYLWECLNA